MGSRELVGGAFIIGVAAVVGLAGLVLTTSAQGNAGDVWVDNVGQPAGPGHENDPHLRCADINLWGNGLADASGSFVVDSWSPSGNGASAYGPAAWTYDGAKGGDQVVAIIPIASLMSGSGQNGDLAQAQQGLHFKLQFVQDPQKHKVFWVSCVTPTPTPTGTPTPPPSGSPTPPPSGSPTPPPSGSPTPPPSGTPTPTPTTTGSISPTATSTGSPSSSAAAILANTGGGASGTAGTAAMITVMLLLFGGLMVAGGTILRRQR